MKMKHLKDGLKIIRPDDYSKLCREHRQMGISPYYYDLVKLYSFAFLDLAMSPTTLSTKSSAFVLPFDKN